MFVRMSGYLAVSSLCLKYFSSLSGTDTRNGFTSAMTAVHGVSAVFTPAASEIAVYRRVELQMTQLAQAGAATDADTQTQT